MVELVGDADSVQFWSQPQTIVDLRLQLVDKLYGAGRRKEGLVKIDVRLQTLHFRSESEFGLMETKGAKCVVVILEA